MKFHDIKEFKRGIDDYPDHYETDKEFPCPKCNANHTHLGNFKGKKYRICYDCGEVIE